MVCSLWKVTFRGDELAMVVVVGDGDMDLDLYIYDNNGNLIESDTDYSDDCVCTWTPRWTGNFRIKINNRGSMYNMLFYALTNWHADIKYKNKQRIN